MAVVDVLLLHGANISFVAKGDCGRLPIHLAVMANHVDGE